MSKGINKVILVGNVGADPKIIITKNNAKIASFPLATSDSWKDKLTGEAKEKTEWHRIVFYGRPADFIAQYIQKGTKVYIEGSLQTHKWVNKENIEQYTTEIAGREIQILSSKKAQQSQQELPQDDEIGNKQETLIDDDIPF